MDEKKISRRSFLNTLWLGLGLVALAEFLAVAASWFRPRKRAAQAAAQDTVVVAGPVDEFEPGSVNAFVNGRFYLARLEDGGFLALSRSCTHLGCSVPWIEEENRFLCPCHSSAFDLKGDVIDPPAPRAMDLFEVTIENGTVIVDTGKRTRRSRFAPGQATYPLPV